MGSHTALPLVCRCPLYGKSVAGVAGQCPCFGALNSAQLIAAGGTCGGSSLAHELGQYSAIPQDPLIRIPMLIQEGALQLFSLPGRICHCLGQNAKEGTAMTRTWLGYTDLACTFQGSPKTPIIVIPSRS